MPRGYKQTEEAIVNAHAAQRIQQLKQDGSRVQATWGDDHWHAAVGSADLLNLV